MKWSSRPALITCLLSYRYSGPINPTTVFTRKGWNLFDSKQVIRAGLEDHFMGKLHGLPMGVDVCYTNHMKADQSDVEVLATLLTTAGCNYFMGIPAGDDIMLNYQTTGFHDNQSLRELFGKHPIKEFKEWLVKYGFMTEDGKLTEKAGDPSVFLK